MALTLLISLEKEKLERKIILATIFTAMFLLLSTCFAELPGQKPGPIIDELHTVAIADPSAAIAALKTGELDVAGIASLTDLQSLQSLGFKIVQQSYYNHGELTLNLHRTPLDDINFRRAIAHLTPKEDVLSTLWGTLGRYEKGFVTPSFGEWYDANIPDVTTFDPELAKNILDSAGYEDIDGDGWREYPNGTKMQQLAIVTWTERTAAEGAFTERLSEEMQKVGIPTRLEYTAYAGGAWYTRIYINHDFDIWRWTWGWGPDPRILELCYASYSIDTSLNGGYYNSTEFDKQLYICLHTLNETEAVAASNKMQEILVNDLPSIPLWEPLNTFAVNPNVLGDLSLPYYGGMMGLLKMRLKSGIGGTIKIVGEEPSSLIPGWDWSGGTYWCTWWTCDSTIEANPVTNALVPWTVTAWKVEPWSNQTEGVANGTKITLTVADNLTWQDGVKFTADDLAFAAKYARDYQAPRLGDVTGDLVDAKAISDSQAEFYYNKTSIFLIRFLSTTYLSAFPKHLYNPNATIYGEPEGPMGLQTAGKRGVPDPSTFAPGYKPYPNPPADKPWLTCFIGVGPYIFKSYEPGVGGIFVANRAYHITVLVSDVNFDRVVNIVDMSIAARSYNSKLGEALYNDLVDINGDNVINIVDLTVIAKDFRKQY